MDVLSDFIDKTDVDMRHLQIDNDSSLSTAETSNSGNSSGDIILSQSFGLSATNSTAAENPMQIQRNSLSVEEKELIDACQKTSYLDGRFFDVVLKDSNITGRITAKCVICAEMFRGDLKVSSNFVRHIKRQHPEKISEYDAHKLSKRRRLSEPEIFRRVTCSFSQEKFEHNVTHFLLDNQLSFQTVENPAFRKMFDDLKIKHGNQQLKHMTRYRVGKKMNDLHNKQVSEIRKAMNSANYICTTADIWTGSNRRFLGVTAHWIDEKTLERKSAALACRRFPGTHSFDNIAEMLEGIHTTFGLTCDKIIATVTDNGSNFVKAFQEFGIDDPECFSQESDESSGENLAQENASANANASASTSAGTENVCNENNEVFMDAAEAAAQNVDVEEFDYECRMIDSENIIISNDEISTYPMLSRHFRCASHTLSLIATTDTTSAINECPRIKTAHRNAMDRCQDLWKCLNSPKKREELRNLIRCSLKRPIPTRWNSLYDALKQIHSLREKIMGFEVHSIIQTTRPFRDQDFEYITEYLQWCKPLATAIDILQGEQYCHYGYLLPSLLSIRKKWESLVQGSHLAICRPLVEILQNSLERRFCEYFHIEGKGEFAAIAAFTHPKFKTSWMSALKEDAKEKVKELAHNIMRPARNEQPAAPQSQDADDDFFDFGENNSDLFFTTAFVPQGQEENELMKYFNETSTSFDLLEKYSLVKKLFIKYNTALPSSAPVERLFSYATLLNLPKFNRLSDSQFEKRVLYKANARKKYL